MPLKKTELTSGTVVSREEPVSEVPESQEEDVRYYKLAKPITVSGTVLDKLLLDPTELGGPVYFRLVARLRKEYPDIYRQSINKLGEEVFLSYIIAELNPPMTVEDLAKVSFVDLPVMFMHVLSLSFRHRTQETEATS
jgi:hypothetical protein